MLEGAKTDDVSSFDFTWMSFHLFHQSANALSSMVQM
jgi:hypothetical protein